MHGSVSVYSLLSITILWPLPSMSLISVVLVTKCIASYNQRRLYKSFTYSSKRRFTYPSLLTG